ncbi:MAG TPA: glycosyltransferase family 4 protein [Pseudoxanthomonas sp.]|nr:glycosyltransferase family 4 protein [Pseudoxanthomonas sp.]
MTARATTSPAVWFPAIRAGSGVDVFTTRLVRALERSGIRAEIEWLPHRAEYLPWTVPMSAPPFWANIVHVNTWLPARFIPAGLPVVATIHHATHDPAVSASKGLLRRLYHGWWVTWNERKAMQRSSHVVAVSVYAGELARRYVHDRPLRIIPNGVDAEVFFPHTRHECGKPFRLLYVGKWSRLKGVEILAPIMSRLGKDFQLDYTGPREGLVVGMPENARNIGRLDGDAAVADAMRNADALILPSATEGFGLVVAEAMSCGLPVVVSDIPALQELVADGASGFRCEVGNVDSFVAAVRRLARDNESRRLMASEARRRAVEGYSLEEMTRKYISLYRECLGGREVASQAARALIGG